jgi:hypothetical protein
MTATRPHDSAANARVPAVRNRSRSARIMQAPRRTRRMAGICGARRPRAMVSAPVPSDHYSRAAGLIGRRDRRETNLHQETLRSEENTGVVCSFCIWPSAAA